MEEAGKKMEQAQTSGDLAAAGKAAADILGAMAGGGGSPIPASDLKLCCPILWPACPANRREAQGGGAMGIAACPPRRCTVRVISGWSCPSPTWGPGGLLGGRLGQPDGGHDSSDAVEKDLQAGPRTVREQYRKDGSHGEYMLILGNGMLVEAKGQNTLFGDITRSRCRGSGQARSPAAAGEVLKSWLSPLCR